MYITGNLGKQKRVSDPLELKLQKVVGFHVVTGKQGPLQE